MITEKDAIRLHIGCGPIRLDGFVNIDARETPATDLVADAWDLSRFADASVSFIYCRHMIEHLTLAQARQSLSAPTRTGEESAFGLAPV
jgi:predicted SAM-dependent methyltransferase